MWLSAEHIIHNVQHVSIQEYDIVLTYHDRQLSILWPMHQPRHCYRKCRFFVCFFFVWLPTPFIGGVICKICQWVEIKP